MRYRFTRCGLISLAVMLLAIYLATSAVASDSETSPPRLDTADAKKITELKNNVYDTVKKDKLLGMKKIIAFEEHPEFVYVLGTLDVGEKIKPAVRRFLLLRPSTVYVEDFWPASKSLFTCRSQGYSIGNPLAAHSEGMSTSSGTQLNVVDREEGGRKFTLTLPTPAMFVPNSKSPATIKIIGTGGKPILPERPLAAGILPHTPEGIKLLARWDRSYHDNKRPPWDTGRPAGELKKLVEKRGDKKGRALVLGCGTGTNAIYLAQQGYDVSGIDIAPTALSRAAAKSKKAGVKVNWLLADVLNTPDLEAFDVIFDRGCYHGVRRHDPKGYVNTIKKMSKPGTQILILAGNANEERHYGPPRVKEEEVRGDFSKDFDFVHLNETRFDSATKQASGALVWSILLEPKKK